METIIEQMEIITEMPKSRRPRIPKPKTRTAKPRILRKWASTKRPKSRK
jgi:hypothetical protein